MSEWIYTKLSEIADFSQGVQVDIEKQFKETAEGRVRFIRIVDFTKGSEDDIRYIKNPGERYQVEPDDLVMIRYGSQTAGKIAKGFKGVIANNTFKITPKSNTQTNKNYLYYFLKQNEVYEFFKLMNASSTMPAITFSMAGSLELLLPPLHEQEGIAEVLSSLDDKIDLLHRQNKTLEEMAETLFRQWFVEEAEDEIVEISLYDISKHVKRSINPNKSPEQLFKHYSLPSFDSGRNPEIQFGREILSNKYQVSPGQILISKLNPRTPRVWYINSCDNQSICSTEFQVYEPIKKEYTEFIYCLLKSNDTRDILTGASSGTSGSHQRVNPEDINKLTIKKPCEGRIKQFHQMASVWLYKIDKNSIQIQQLETLRDTLLPKLMSGLVTVNEII